MADRGSIGKRAQQATSPSANPAALPSATYKRAQSAASITNWMFSPVAATSIAGTLEDPSGFVAKIVRLYDSVSGEFLGQATSSAVDGTFEIPARGKTKVLVVGINEPDYNAIVYDGVVPL